MNNQNPLIPQGSALEQRNKGRARVQIAVFFVLAIHGIGLMALLMQGCGQSKEPVTPTETEPSSIPPAFVEPTAPPVTTGTPPVVASAPVVEEPPAPPTMPADATEYTIVKGDYLEKLARDFHTSVKAIIDANPGIEPTKLKIGQKIRIPAAGAAAAPAVTGATPVESAGAGEDKTYTVKSGDNLTKIATQFGTTIKALRTANGLKTDSIKVGQKLKIPANASAPVPAPIAPVEPGPTIPTTPPPSAP